MPKERTKANGKGKGKGKLEFKKVQGQREQLRSPLWKAVFRMWMLSFALIARLKDTHDQSKVGQSADLKQMDSQVCGELKSWILIVSATAVLATDCIKTSAVEGLVPSLPSARRCSLANLGCSRCGVGSTCGHIKDINSKCNRSAFACHYPA